MPTPTGGGAPVGSDRLRGCGRGSFVHAGAPRPPNSGGNYPDAGGECDIVEPALSDTQATAQRIALNRIAELAEWDDDALAKLLHSFQGDGVVDGLGWDQAELDELLRGLDAPVPGTVDDPGPCHPPEQATTKRGDLWQLGDHRLLCGDSTSADDFSRLMAGDKARLWSSAPPYCVNYTGNDRPIHGGKPSGKNWTHVYREIAIADLGVFLACVFKATLPHLVEDRSGGGLSATRLGPATKCSGICLDGTCTRWVDEA
ncbi:MAG: hypothetical protein HY874_03085 [Chloroflexi bacterium]|nr:hypothetical protein [Chloroflexota bacterium]